jgi:hypothetical protein
MPAKTADTPATKTTRRKAGHQGGGPGTVPPSADLAPIVVCSSDEYLDPRDLVPLERNPRQITDGRRAALGKSLADLGLFRPLLVWRSPDGPVVIGGNQKLPILQDAAGKGTPFLLRDGTRVSGVPVTYFEGTEARARIVALRDNNADGDWDTAGLAEYLRELETLGALPADLTLTGFDDALLDDLAASYRTAPIAEPAPPAGPTPSAEGAPENAPGPQPGSAPTAAAPAGASALNDPTEQQISVVIGHVRGKIKAPTYERLIKALTEGLANGIPEGGLDAAFVALLDRVGQ